MLAMQIYAGSFDSDHGANLGRAWSHLGKQHFPVSKMLTRLHELITLIPAEISGTF